MHFELIILAWGCVLGLVHVFAAGQVKTRQYGAKWNTGARDETLPPPEPVVGRMMRAQANYFETFPIVVAAILIVTVAGLSSEWTRIGAAVWLAARILYLPLYAAGVPKIRTMVFLISVIGLAMILWPTLL
jgi:uncharacterized MAPEG superfamily protein